MPISPWQKDVWAKKSRRTTDPVLSNRLSPIFLPTHLFAANRKRGHCALSDKQNVPLFVSRQNLINPVRPSEALGLAKGGNGKARIFRLYRLGKKMCGRKNQDAAQTLFFQIVSPPSFCPLIILPIHVFAANRKRGHCALSDKQNVPLFVSRQNLINPVRPSEALGLAKGGNGKKRTLCSFRLGKKMCGQKIKTQHRPCSFKSSFPHLFAHPCFCCG